MRHLRLISYCYIIITLYSCQNKSDQSDQALEFNSSRIQKMTTIHEDSLKKNKAEKHYMSELLYINNPNNLIKIPPLDKAYEVNDTARINPIQIFNDHTNTLVIRYSTIGCNTCSKALFHTLNLESFEWLSTSYKILVLTDYVDYLAFLKWYKITDLNERTLWIEKGGIPIPLEHNTETYMFTINENNNVSSVFIPNSLFPEYISRYLNSIKI